MTSLRRFAYAVLLAVTTLNLAPSTASAQEPARGHFTLTHDVHWGNAMVPAGDYKFTFGTNGSSPVLTLEKVTEPRARFMLLVQATEGTKTADTNRLLLKMTADGRYVSALQLPEFGMTLIFAVPEHAMPKQIAKTATMTTASGQ